MFTLDTTVLGGLPITVEFSIESADPEVGIQGGGVDEWYVTHINGRKRGNVKWLYKQIEDSGELDRLLEKCRIYASEQNYSDQNYDYYDDVYQND